MPLLVIKNLSKIYEDKKAVHNLSFSLEKGEILGILGESGSGKTTLLHLIAGIKQPDGGTLLLGNQPITPPSEKLIAGHPDIKLVRQDYGLFPNISLRENIEYELRFYEESYRNKRVNRLLKLGGLWQIQDHLPREVSGGEQQRTVILRTLAEQPTLLLLDEPFSHLDARNKRKLKAEILHIIKDEGVSCIFVTHDSADVYGIADRIAVMQKGKFLQIDNPEKIYNEPQNLYVAEITGDLALLNPKDDVERQFLFLRPEHLTITENYDFLANVENSIFMGNHYEIIVAKEKVKFKVYTHKSLPTGEKIGIKIKK